MIAKEFHLGSDFPKIDHATWRKEVEADLKGAPFAKRMISQTYEGIELQPLYTEETFPTAATRPDCRAIPRSCAARSRSATRWLAGTSARSTRIPIPPLPMRRSSRTSMAV